MGAIFPRMLSTQDCYPLLQEWVRGQPTSISGTFGLPQNQAQSGDKKEQLAKSLEQTLKPGIQKPAVNVQPLSKRRCGNVSRTIFLSQHLSAQMYRTGVPRAAQIKTLLCGASARLIETGGGKHLLSPERISPSAREMVFPHQQERSSAWPYLLSKQLLLLLVPGIGFSSSEKIFGDIPTRQSPLRI